MKNIVITGGIGTGKSFVSAEIAAKLDIPHIDYDQAWHEELASNQGLKQAIIKRFGSVVTSGELQTEIDRRKLGRIVFSSKDIMKEYMETVSVYLKKMEAAIIEQNKGKAVIFEIPVSFNYVPMDSFPRKNTLFVGVFASRDTQIRRIVTRSRWKVTAQDAGARIDFQPEPSSYMHKCDICFWNEDKSPIDELVELVKAKRRR